MIGVTGGIGTGKSTVSKILAFALGAELIDTDQLCREQLRVGAEGYRKLNEFFGPRFTHPDKSLNRELLRQHVFADDEIKRALENILHPLVAAALHRHQRECNTNSRQLVVEVPLLFEVGWQELFDNTVVVYVPPAVCADRVVLRDGLSPQLIEKIILSQMAIEEKRRLADYCVDNSTTYASTMQQTHWLSRVLKGQKNSGHSR